MLLLLFPHHRRLAGSLLMQWPQHVFANAIAIFAITLHTSIAPLHSPSANKWSLETLCQYGHGMDACKQSTTGALYCTDVNLSNTHTGQSCHRSHWNRLYLTFKCRTQHIIVMIQTRDHFFFFARARPIAFNRKSVFACDRPSKAFPMPMYTFNFVHCS